MAGHRRYTKAQKVAAVAQAEMTSAEAASEATGIPRRTIGYWLDQPEFAELRRKTRDEMADGFRVLIHKAQARLEQLIPTMEPRDLTVLLGVATDKAQLLDGGATARTETRMLGDDLDDHERAALKQVIASELADREVAGSDSGAGLDPAAPPGATA